MGLDGFTSEFYQTFKNNTNPSHFLLENREGASNYSEPEPEEDITGKENYTSISFMNIEAKVYKILANPNKWHIKTIVHHDQGGLIPRMQG